MERQHGHTGGDRPIGLHIGEAPAVQGPCHYVGLDVGSTTVKAVVVRPDTGVVLWQDYRRHHARQAETVLAFLERIEVEVPGFLPAETRLYVTGSGASSLMEPLGARFVQEVNALTLAVERLHPEVNSVVELGGQDAKIIVFRPGERGERRAWSSMNDRCAAGTGATIDKCVTKIGVPAETLGAVHLQDGALHHVAAKCGVFAEMDVVNLLKSGVPAEEILCSLGDAIVQQNLSVLARGHTLRPDVLLLGGPLYYLPFLQESWRFRIAETWAERGVVLPDGATPETAITVPERALYYAAYGAVVYGLSDGEHATPYRGLEALRALIAAGREHRLRSRTDPPLAADEAELARFRERYAVPAFRPPALPAGGTVRAALGVDGGSTSTKAALLAEDGTVLAKAYCLSRGNPIEDTRTLLATLRDQAATQGATLDVVAFGATGYAGAVLERAMRADVNVPETVAHMKSAVHLFGDVDVICDVGGQDIKVLFMCQGELRQFRLSNQCSAGNGMLLQATANQFGLPVEDYAAHAFRARVVPRFTAGCAVFLDSDRVALQREGFTPDELMAGLARVLPKNIWQHVVQVPRLSRLGRRYVLQGGTQYNLAAVKAQVDYVRERVPDAEVRVHPHPGEAGAIGAAMDALEVVHTRGHSTFVGLEQAIAVTYTTRTDQSTRCPFCPNHCARTFIDTCTPDGASARYISGASCERGFSADVEALKAYQRERRERAQRVPNLAQVEAQRLFAAVKNPEPLPAAGTPVTVPTPRRWWRRESTATHPFRRSGADAAAYRADVRIGMPRCLDVWNTAPFWRAYFATLGVPAQHLVFSRESGERMFAEGAKYGAVDPCYPAKVVQAHVHDLITHQHNAERPLHYVFFPTVTRTLGCLPDVRPYACPVVTGTANVIKAAFTAEADYFGDRGIEYVDPAIDFADRERLSVQLFAAWGDRLRATRDESDFALAAALRAMSAFEAEMQAQGRAVLEQAEREGRYCVLLVGRPYHLDPGLNHGVPEQMPALGFPVVTLRSLPRDPAWLLRLFGADVRAGRIEHPLDVRDVWPLAHTANSGLKVWGAKVAARSPLLAVLDLSSFKCGHDAPTYGLIDDIVTSADVPYLALHDLDANRPTGTLQIRLRTFAHALRRREHWAAEARPDEPAAPGSRAAQCADTPRVPAGALGTHDGNGTPLPVTT